MRLLLIRHGETPSNVIHALDTSLPGPGLTDRGRAQAEALPGTLADERLEAIWASEARRAQETAAPLGRERRLAVQTLPGMFEIQAGELEMKTDPDSLTAYIEAIGAWGSGDLDVRIPGGENGVEVLSRIDTGLQRVAETGASVAAVVSHGAVLRVWSGVRATNLDREFITGHAIDNTGVIVLDGDPDTGWVARSWMGEVVEARA